MRHWKGFTRIELLATVSVALLSVSVLMPVLAKNRQSARLAACRSNQKAITVYLNAQAADNNGKYPERNNMTFPNQVDIDTVPNVTNKTIQMLRDYVSGEKGRIILFCPLRSKSDMGVGANPGLDLRNVTIDWYSQREKDLAKYFYVSPRLPGSSGYWIGYNMYAGLMGDTIGMWRLNWTYSNNSSTSGPPMTPGSSKDAIITDMAQATLGYNWSSSHAVAGTQWSNNKFDTVRGFPFPAKDPGANIAYSDGHVECHKKTTSYIKAGSTGWYWFW